MERAPESFFCPIDYVLMINPVVIETGQTYCRGCIAPWFEDHDTCPLTGVRLSHKTMTRNHALRNAIEEYRQTHCKLIPRSCVTLHEMIGRGSFKVVHRTSLTLPGASRAITVAALVVQTGDISAEVATLLKLQHHPCLVTFIGHCDDNPATPTPTLNNNNNKNDNRERILLTEFASGGGLDQFIYELGDNGESLSLNHKLAILQQVDSGMEALGAVNIVHRDLACRNVLVFVIDKADVGKTNVKICDFGLALDVHSKVYIDVTGGALPVRCMSPEALDKGRFSTKSDVWAFGVFAFELLSDGRIPYGEVLEANVRAHIIQGNTLTCPHECASLPQLWNIVETCFDVVPNKRPTFQTLGVALGQLPAHLAPHPIVPAAVVDGRGAVAVDGSGVGDDDPVVVVDGSVVGDDVAVVVLSNVQTKVYADREKYVGEMKDRIRHGQGTYFFANGDRYEGDFKDGKKHGHGTFVFADGDRYEGEYKDNKKLGQGTCFYASGNRYEGDWKDSKKHGKGTFFWADGNRYEGDYKDDKKHGQGTFFFANGNRYEGDWEDNKNHGQGKTFNAQGRIFQQGRWENNKFLG